MGDGYPLGAVPRQRRRFDPPPSGYKPPGRISRDEQEEQMDTRADKSSGLGISLGGIIVIVDFVLMFVVSFWLGLIVTLVGLIAFGGFARGKWY